MTQNANDAGEQAETTPSGGLTMDEWCERAIQNMNRLATDEAYREEIDQIRMGFSKG